MRSLEDEAWIWAPGVFHFKPLAGPILRSPNPSPSPRPLHPLPPLPPLPSSAFSPSRSCISLLRPAARMLNFARLSQCFTALESKITPCAFHAIKVLHEPAFTQTIFCTKDPLHKRAFTQTNFYTNQPLQYQVLYQLAVSQASLYTTQFCSNQL